MKKLLIALLFVASFCQASDLYPPLTDYSFEALGSWTQPMIGSGTSLPIYANLADGDFFFYHSALYVRSGGNTRALAGASVYNLQGIISTEAITRASADNLFVTPSGSSANQTFLAYNPATATNGITKQYFDGLQANIMPDITASDWSVVNTQSSYYMQKFLNQPKPIASSSYYKEATLSNAGKYASAVTMPNGNVFLVPGTSDVGAFYNPYTNAITTMGTVVTTDDVWSTANSVLYKNKIYLTPATSDNIGAFDYTTNTYASGLLATTTDNAWRDAALLPNGKILYMPNLKINGSTKIGIFDVTANTFSMGLDTGIVYVNQDTWDSAIVAPNNKVYFTPNATTTMAIYDIAGNSMSYVATSTANVVKQSILLPNGNILMMCYSGLIVFDTTTNTYGQMLTTGARILVCLIPDGRVALIPEVIQTATIDYYNWRTNTIEVGQPMNCMAVFSNPNLWNGALLLCTGNILCVQKPANTYGFGLIYTGFGSLDKWFCASPWVSHNIRYPR